MEVRCKWLIINVLKAWLHHFPIDFEISSHPGLRYLSFGYALFGRSSVPLMIFATSGFSHKFLRFGEYVPKSFFV